MRNNKAFKNKKKHFLDLENLNLEELNSEERSAIWGSNWSGELNDFRQHHPFIAWGIVGVSVIVLPFLGHRILFGKRLQSSQDIEAQKKPLYNQGYNNSNIEPEPTGQNFDALHKIGPNEVVVDRSHIDAAPQSQPEIIKTSVSQGNHASADYQNSNEKLASSTLIESKLNGQTSISPRIFNNQRIDLLGEAKHINPKENGINKLEEKDDLPQGRIDGINTTHEILPSSPKHYQTEKEISQEKRGLAEEELFSLQEQTKPLGGERTEAPLVNAANNSFKPFLETNALDGSFKNEADSLINEPLDKNSAGEPSKNLPENRLTESFFNSNLASHVMSPRKSTSNHQPVYSELIKPTGGFSHEQRPNEPTNNSTDPLTITMRIPTFEDKGLGNNDLYGSQKEEEEGHDNLTSSISSHGTLTSEREFDQNPFALEQTEPNELAHSGKFGGSFMGDKNSLDYPLLPKKFTGIGEPQIGVPSFNEYEDGNNLASDALAESAKFNGEPLATSQTWEVITGSLEVKLPKPLPRTQGTTRSFKIDDKTTKYSHKLEFLNSIQSTIDILISHYDGDLKLIACPDPTKGGQYFVKAMEADPSDYENIGIETLDRKLGSTEIADKALKKLIQQVNECKSSRQEIEHPFPLMMLSNREVSITSTNAQKLQIMDDSIIKNANLSLRELRRSNEKNV